MLGVAGTTVWMYENDAPPGWKVSTTGYGTTLAVHDDTGTSKGTTDGLGTNQLVHTLATFQTDGVEVGDTAYNQTDDTVATVTEVTSETVLTLDGNIFASGEDYIVGKAYVEDGGRQASDGSWTIDGISASNEDSHTHTGGGTGSIDTSGTTSQTNTRTPVHIQTDDTLQVGSESGSAKDIPTKNVTINAGNTGTGTAHSHTVTQDATWRPSASIGRLFDLDTA